MNVWFLHQSEYNNQSKYKDVQFTPMIMYMQFVFCDQFF